MTRPLTDRGRSPAEIDAEISRLQEGIRQAASAVDTAMPGGSRGERAEYHAAAAEVSRATRALVDFEASIPELAWRHRTRVAARTARLACAGLLTVSAGVCVAAAFGVVSPGWFGVAVPLLLTALMALPGMPARASGPRFRARTGAAAFGVAAALTVLGCADVVSAWTALLALVAAAVGLAAFGVLKRREPRFPGSGLPERER